MAKIEKVVTVRVKNNLFDFKDIVSFRTKNFIGELIEEGAEGMREFIIFNINSVRYIDDKFDRIYVENLEDLVDLVEYSTGEEIINVYLDHIITINSDISM